MQRRQVLHPSSWHRRGTAMSNISGLGRGTRTRVRRSHTATVFEIEARAALAAVRMIRPSIGLRDGRAKFEESESLHHHIVVVRALIRIREARLDRLPARVDQRSPMAPLHVLLARHPYLGYRTSWCRVSGLSRKYTSATSFTRKSVKLVALV